MLVAWFAPSPLLCSTSPGATTSGADDAAAAASAAAQDDDDDDERLPGGVTGTTIEISSGGGAPHAPHAAHGAGTGSQTHAATPGRLGAVAAILARTKRPTTAPPQEPSSHAAPPSSTAADGTSCPRNDARPPLGASSSVASGGEGGRGQQAQHGHAHTNPVWDLLAGSAAGATAVVLTYPLDVIRTRLAWTTAGAAGPSSVAVATGAHATSSATTAAGASAAAAAHASGASTAARELGLTAMAAHMYRTEGVQGLYRGMAPTLLGILPYAGVKFYVYQSLKNLYNSRVADAGGGGGGRDGGGRDDGSCSGSNSAAASAAGGEAAAEGSGAGRKGRRGRMPVHVMLACGAVSGLISQTLTYPLDVVRRRMQVRQQPHKPGAGGGAAMHSTRTEQPAGAAAAAAARSSSSGDPTTTLQTFRAVLREEGPRGLFRGLSINFMKVVPSTAVGFALYDACKSYLDLQGNL